MKKTVSIFLALILVVVSSFSVYASDAEQENSITLYDSAGKNGFYEYDEESDSFVHMSSSEYDYPTLEEISPLASQEPTDATPNVVIGSDNRTIVSSPSAYLASTCLIGARFSSGVLHATGWLISDQYLLTVAHAVVKVTGESSYERAQHVAVYVGASGGTYKQYRLGQVVAFGGDYVDLYNDNNRGRYDDWAVVKLDSPITVNVQCLNLRAVNKASDMTGTYWTQGYPCDRNGCPSKAWNLKDMYKCSGTILGDDNGYLSVPITPNSAEPNALPVVTTSIDIANGQSGSPVWQGATAEAMVVAGTNYAGNPENYLILINNFLYNYLQTNCM